MKPILLLSFGGMSFFLVLISAINRDWNWTIGAAFVCLLCLVLFIFDHRDRHYSEDGTWRDYEDFD